MIMPSIVQLMFASLNLKSPCTHQLLVKLHVNSYQSLLLLANLAVIRLLKIQDYPDEDKSLK